VKPARSCELTAAYDPEHIDMWHVLASAPRQLLASTAAPEPPW
jgi:hypothetical protein